MLALIGCLINTELYERRMADLTDHDGDGFVQEDDCDDTDVDSFPGAEERCDARDNDCDGEIDDDAADASTWYPDTDADSFGDALGAPLADCVAPAGHVANALDCDDGDTNVNPGASELPYDGLDNDCADGDLVDADSDGHDALEAGGDDCNDAEPAVNPSAAEVPYDGVDNDCDGEDDDDLDGDGATGLDAGGDDCDDSNAEVYPGAEETWANGVTDNDCDGEIEAVTLAYGAEAWVGASPGAQAGRRVSALGDITGDGLAEYLVGAVYESSEHAYDGAVYVVPGGYSAGDLADATTLLPSDEYWFLPQVVEGGPDFTGDGVADMVITATGAGASGAAFLLSGADLAGTGEALVEDLSLATIEGNAEDDYAGTGAAFVGDVMGDGQEYLVVTALLADPSGLRDAGRAAAFSLDTLADSTLGEGDMVVDGPYDDAAIGNHVMGPVTLTATASRTSSSR